MSKKSNKKSEKKVNKESKKDADVKKKVSKKDNKKKTTTIEKKKKILKKDDEKQSRCDKLQKNNKTLLAIVILLAGIAAGSFFVDIAQLFSGKGFSARALKDAQVVEYDGNTWVRYDDPKVVVDVFDATDCEDCVTDEVLVRLRSLIPTLEAHRIDVRTEEGSQYARENDIKHIPAFLFTDDIIDSDFYQGAAILFKDAPNDKYYFEAANVGVPIGEYLETPSADNGIVIGNDDAKVDVVVFTDFTCAMCKTVDPIISKIQEEFKDDVKIIVKTVPDAEQKNAMKLANAAVCADEQDAFDKYGAIIFKNQKILKESDDVNITLIKYATSLKLDAEKFEECLNSKEIEEKVKDNITEASRFGITGTPTLFINGQPHVGVITYENLKEQIEAIVNPEESVQE
ncbi:MAG: DsbA family protein [Candidatus Moraniibacteriota bacterium]|jgi:protein-disulfide isomerase